MRDARLDFIKAFALLAVVLGHISNPFSPFIYIWHIPLFFFASGFTLNTTKPLADLVKKDVQRLIVPFFIFSLIGIGVELVKRALLGRSFESASQIINSTFVFINSTTTHHYGFVLWFLPALFFGKIIANILIRKNIYIAFVMSVIVFFVAAYIKTNNNNVWPFAIQQSFLSVFFIVAGFYMKNFPLRDKWLNWYLSVCGFAVFILLSKYGFPVVDYGASNISYPFFVLNCSLFFCVLLYQISGFFCGKLNYFTKLSGFFMLVFIFHPYTNNIADLLVNKYLSGFSMKYIYMFFLSFVFLLPLMVLKSKFNNLWIFKYV